MQPTPPHLHSAPLALMVALALGTPGLVHAQAANTDNKTVALSIAAQPLSAALHELSAATGTAIGFSPALVAGKTAHAAKGTLTVQQAIDQLLLGTALIAVWEGDSIIVKGESASTGPVTQLETVTIKARTDSTTEGTDSLTTRTVSINKGDQAIKDIPQSISVITRKQLDEQGIVDLRDAANTVTGAVGVKGVGQGMVLSARGFQINDWQYDGVAVPRNTYALGNWGAEEMVFYDRLEVLRGASGLLQGTGSPGGAVNLVRKRGPTEKTVSVTARAGSWDRYGLQLDAGSPLNAEGTLRGRFVVDEARSHSFVDYVNNRTRSFYGALDFDLSPDTTVGLGVSYMNSQGRPMIRGLPRYTEGGDVGLPRSTFSGAWWNHAHLEQTTFYADLDHRFNANWKFKVSALHTNENNTSKHQRVQGAVVASGSGLTYANWITDFDSKRVGLDAYVNGQFNALGLDHEVTLGANYSKYTSDDMWIRVFTPGGNIFSIDHNRTEPSVQSMLASGNSVQNISTYDVQQKGVYGSWRARISDPLTAILGVRASWYDYLYSVPQTGSQSVYTASAEITPYVGLVYAVSPQWSLYSSYTSVFEPQSAKTVEGNVLDPIKGTNLELGIKGELLDGRVNTSLAVFRYDHKNRAVNDVASGYACDGWYCSVATGKVRSQGIEAEVSGEVLPNLQVMAGYTYNTTKYLSDPTLKGETYSTWTPKHMFRLWASYRLPGEWNRLTIGGGATVQSHTLGYDRSFKVPGYAVANLRLGYQLTPEINLALNLNNVFDKRYWTPGYAEKNGNNTYGDPRNLMITLRYAPRL